MDVVFVAVNRNSNCPPTVSAKVAPDAVPPAVVVASVPAAWPVEVKLLATGNDILRLHAAAVVA